MQIYSVLGETASKIFRKDRQKAMDNLSIAFPEAAPMVRAAMTKAMYRTLGENIYEFINIKGASRNRIASLVEEIEGEEFLKDAYDEKRGVIAITGHIGCWELLGAHLVSRGYAVSVVARQLLQERWQERVESIRSSLGVATIDRDGGARQMLKSLRRGEILGVLMDQNTRVDGLYVPFFNRPAHTPSGVAKLSLLSGVKIVPMAIYINPKCKHVIRILNPICPTNNTGNRDEAIKAITTACSQAIETLIRYDPKQWIWWHDRWPVEKKEWKGMNYAVRN